MLKHNFFYTYMDKDPDAGGGGGGDDPPPDPDPNAPPSGDDPPSPFYSTIPETWRSDLIDGLELEGEDKDKRLGQLNRLTDLRSMTKSYFESQDKIREGIKPQGLPEGATDEQITEYREANGIPAEAENYVDGLDEGLQLGEEDTRILGEVYKTAHELNLSTDAVNKLTNTMLGARQIEEDAISAQDGVDKQTSDRQMRDAWGNDYQTNVGMVKGLVNLLPETVREDFENARLSDGKALFNSPEVLVFLGDIARKMNPAGTVVPNSATPGADIAAEIKELEARMGDDDWHKDVAANNRLMELYDAQKGMKKAS